MLLLLPVATIMKLLLGITLREKVEELLLLVLVAALLTTAQTQPHGQPFLTAV